MSQTIYVSPGEDLQAVFDNAPENATIRLAPGIYRQKIIIRTPGLLIIGAGADRTQICFDDYARKQHPIGGEFNTFRTYTLAVCADGITMEDLKPHIDAEFEYAVTQSVLRTKVMALVRNAAEITAE